MKRKFEVLLVRRFNNVIMFLKKCKIFPTIFLTVFLDFLIPCQAIQHYCSENSKWSWFAFSIVHIIMLNWSAFLTIKEHKRENSYMSNFWEITWFFILFIYYLTTFKEPIIPKLSVFTRNKNIDKAFIFFTVIFIIMIIAWGIYLRTAIKSKRKTKNIDLTELKIIFSKSVLQSIVSFIALFGLSRSFLSNELLYFVLVTDTYAAYIYPILDINKYVREKEIEQLKDKNKTIIYFFK